MSNGRPFRRRIMHNYIRARGHQAINIVDRFWYLMGFFVTRKRDRFRNVIDLELTRRKE